MLSQEAGPHTRRARAQDYAAVLKRHRAARPPRWRVGNKPGQPWLSFAPSRSHVPQQGWKLHVSMAATDAATVADLLLPLLLDAGHPFKIIRTLDDLVRLNSGALDSRQVGKTVTVYPSDDGALARLIARCREILPRRRAPVVASDLPVDVDRGLWIRYGVFTGDPVSDALGRLTVPLRMPDGQAVADERTHDGRQASWAPAPPVPIADWKREDLGRLLTIGNRTYIRSRLIQQKAGTSSALGLAVQDCRTVIIKSAAGGEGANIHGEDAADRLAREHHVLQALADTGCCPAIIAYDADQHILVEEDLGNDVLSLLPSPQSVARLADLASCIARLHGAGYVHRDLKLANIVRHEGAIKLVDLESGAAIGSPPQRGFLSTPAYSPPEARHAPVAPAHDIFALGGCITHACLGVCAGYLPHTRNPERQVGLLKLSGQHRAAAIVEVATATRAADRPTASELTSWLSAALPVIVEDNADAWTGHAGPRDQRDWAVGAALKAGRATRAFRRRERRGYSFRNHQAHAAFACEPINVGAAGIALGLMTIDEALGSEDFRDDALDACAWLAGRPADRQANGLFSGNSGVALVLATAGRRFGREDLVAAARARFAAAAHGSPHADLFSGDAGILWTGTLLAAVLDDVTVLAAVEPLARSLKAQAVTMNGGPGWPSHPDYDASRSVYHGAAHGSAGIALALAAWAEAAGDRTASGLAQETFASLHFTGNAAQVRTAGDAAHPALGTATRWCHGVAGYLWCLLQAFPAGRPEHDALRGAREWAAARLAAAAWPLKDMTLCHGLAGLLDTWRMAGAEPDLQPLADRQGRQGLAILKLLEQDKGDTTVWGAEDSTKITPDLWVGFLGPACVAAMTAAGERASILSRTWLTRCARPRQHARSRATEAAC